MTYNAPPAELKRFNYANVEVPGETGPSLVPVPALLIRMRPAGVDPADAGGRIVQAVAMLDTGASASTVPMWSRDGLGAAVDEGTRQAVLGPSGKFYAYEAKFGGEIEHDEGWLDVGVIDALTPGTEWSRDPKFGLPFLLGRRGLFNKFDMCISESQKAVWLRKIGGWPQIGSQA